MSRLDLKDLGARRGLSLQGVLTTLLVLALLAALGLLLVERNQRRYFLRMQAGLVVVDRGLPLPYGHGPFRPNDPVLSHAYQAFRLPPGVDGLAEDESFDDRGELDQRLGDLLLRSAKARLSASDEGHLEDGMAYLSQADALSELTSEQRHSARQLRSEVAFTEATDEIARALAALKEAQGLLKLSADSANPHAKDSADLLDRVSPPIEQLVRAARVLGVMPADSADLKAPAGSSRAADGGTAP